MYVVHPNWLRPRSRGVLINCEGFTQVHRFKLSFSRCDIFSGSTLPPFRGGIFNWWRCTRQMWYLLWKHKMLKMSTREQCQVKTRPKEKTGKKHDMGYSCF
ncbi:hypothetical protein ACFX2B_035611 [Malus domestica]